MRAPDNKRPTTVSEAGTAIAVLARVPQAQRRNFCDRILAGHAGDWEKEQQHRAGLAFPRDGELAKAARGMRAASNALDKLDVKEQQRVALSFENCRNELYLKEYWDALAFQNADDDVDPILHHTFLVAEF